MCECVCVSGLLFHNPVNKSRSTRNVQLKVQEVQALCMTSREIFLSQPTLLELEAPVTICGESGILDPCKRLAMLFLLLLTYECFSRV